MNKLIGKVFALVAVVALPALSAEAQGARTNGGSRSADPAFWVGECEFVDSGTNASGTRSHATAHQLEIDVEDIDGVYAKYRRFEGGAETPGFEMLFYGARKGNELPLNYEQCFEGHSASCAGYRRGDPMLKRVAKFAGDNKPSVLARWHSWDRPRPSKRAGFISRKSPSSNDRLPHRRCAVEPSMRPDRFGPLRTTDFAMAA